MTIFSSRSRAPFAAALTLAWVCDAVELPGARQEPTGSRAGIPTAFEVASLKRLPTPIAGFIVPEILPGRVRYRFAGFINLVAQGFNVQRVQIVEGPGVAPGLGLVHFELEAKTGLPQEMARARAWDLIKPMLQRLYVDRFKMRFHRESREMRVYALVQAKEGARLTPIKDEDDVKPLGVLTGVGEATYSGSTLQPLCNVLSGRLQAPVIDETGLEGRFNFTVRWLDTAGAYLPESTILREQLGLRLEERRRAIEVLVIDHAEMPTEN